MQAAHLPAMRYIVLFPLLTALIRAQECRLSNVHGDFMVLQRAPQTTTLCVKLAAERARRGRGGARRRGRARRAATPVVGTPNFLTPPHTPTNIRYGFARPNTVITTTFRGTNLTATALASGEWRQALPATPASAPSAGGETISFSCATGEAFALRNVLWGDVVLCGGQSSAWHEQQRALGPQKPTLRPPLPTRTHTPLPTADMQCVFKRSRPPPPPAVTPPPPLVAGSPSTALATSRAGTRPQRLRRPTRTRASAQPPWAKSLRACCPSTSWARRPPCPGPPPAQPPSAAGTGTAPRRCAGASARAAPPLSARGFITPSPPPPAFITPSPPPPAHSPPSHLTAAPSQVLRPAAV